LILGRCNTCYRFHKRTGRERDVEQVIRTNALRLEREIATPHLVRLRVQEALQALNRGEPENRWACEWLR
jgi:hypothetical protein